jgi:hypothetical protein
MQGTTSDEIAEWYDKQVRAGGFFAYVLTLNTSAKQSQAHRIWMYAAQDGRPIYEKAGFVPKKRSTLEMELIW